MKEIKHVEYTKFLGVLIDSNLKWDYHISYIKTKLSKAIGMLNKAKPILGKRCLKTLYNSFLYPHICYCIDVWGSASCTQMNSLMKMQKRAVRLINFANYRDHTDPLFKESKLLKLNQIYTYSIISFMFNVYHKKSPDLFQDMFIRNNELHNYSTRRSLQFHVPLVKTAIRQKSICYKGVYLWNKVCDKVNTDCTIGTFKSRVFNLLVNDDNGLL